MWSYARGPVTLIAQGTNLGRPEPAYQLGSLLPAGYHVRRTPGSLAGASSSIRPREPAQDRRGYAYYNDSYLVVYVTGRGLTRPADPLRIYGLQRNCLLGIPTRIFILCPCTGLPRSSYEEYRTLPSIYTYDTKFLSPIGIKPGSRLVNPSREAHARVPVHSAPGANRGAAPQPHTRAARPLNLGSAASPVLPSGVCVIRYRGQAPPCRPASRASPPTSPC